MRRRLAAMLAALTSAAVVLAPALLAAFAPAAVALDDLDAGIGERLFRRAWVPAQASTTAADGLGPLFNARSCLTCHQGLDRVAARRADAFDRGLVVRLGDRDGRPDPQRGRQIQTMAAVGVEPEILPAVAWRAERLAVGRRSIVAVRPVVAAEGAALRVAPQLRGLGLLAAIPDAAIAAAADPGDRDGDGVRGRVARLPDGTIGRFGWKATAPTLAAEVADAFATDMGLSTARRPDPWGDCTASQATCRAAPHGVALDRAGAARDVEMSEAIVERLALYLASVPAEHGRKTGIDAAAAGRGRGLFVAAGCGACHRADLPSAATPAYTDLLLHDLGPGLDDGVAEGAAKSGEWRTAPLIGIARAEAAGLLHDGRAGSIDEAVAWHGGEASAARARYGGFGREERATLAAFLRSL